MSEFVVAAAQVLDESEPGNDNLGAAVESNPRMGRSQWLGRPRPASRSPEPELGAAARLAVHEGRVHDDASGWHCRISQA